jgi:2-keto-4-pentenoate hydratase/2-oxohepta-3-ene-1,7-dioic acid hydratase in catechol pathway
LRWITYRPADEPAGHELVGLVHDEEIRSMPPGTRLVELIATGRDGMVEAANRAASEPFEVRSIRDAQLLAPIRPPTIRDFSVFEQHVRSGLEAIGQKLGDDFYNIPPFWFANVNAVIGPDAVVEVPANSNKMDYELEIAVVIGVPGRNIDPVRAEDHIAGFLIMNDWSARDLQQKECACMPIGPSKGKDFATTLGPCLVTPDEIEPRRTGANYDLAMRAWVNGRQYSDGNASEMYWSFGELLAYASRNADLVPGDVIAAGTCGTGCILELATTHGGDAYPWLEEGDEIELEIEGIGRMRNRVTRGPEPIPLR